MSNVPDIRKSAKASEGARSRRSFLTHAAGVSALVVPTLTLITTRKARAWGFQKADRPERGVDPGGPG